jgi:predicted DsbA family dithiol-disulfide isomerase
MAFFAQSRCICMRHVLFALAQQVGVDMQRFVEDFDHGVTKQSMISIAPCQKQKSRDCETPALCIDWLIPVQR